MKRKTIVSLAILFFLVISGLVMIQFYWIQNAISITDQQFRYNANKALESVVLDLETQELIDVIVDEIDPESSDSVMVSIPAGSPLANRLMMAREGSDLPQLYGLDKSDKPLIITSSGSKIYISAQEISPIPDDDITEPSAQITSAALSGRVSKKII